MKFLRPYLIFWSKFMHTFYFVAYAEVHYSAVFDKIFQFSVTLKRYS